VFTIGDISKIVNISTNTLRYYDEIGLLKPCLVQSSNQYRYYSDSQIKELTFILELKQYGFSLDEIKILLQDKSNQKLKPMLEERRIELRNEIVRLEEQYISLEKRISKISQGDKLKMKEGKVLVVDDFELARKMVKNIVEEYGYTVIGEASNGEEAVVAYDTLKPDLVIMDIIMPKMDGIDATVEIMKKYQNARIIMCSAMSQAPVILESIKAGARDFISKPISSIRLIQALERGLDDNNTFDTERIKNTVTIIDNKFKEKMPSIELKQEEIDLLIFKSENEQEEVINKIFNKVESFNTNEHRYSINGPFSIELKTLTYLKNKFSELSQEFSCYLSNKFNNECTVKLITIENITLNEFRALLTTDSKVGTIKSSMTSLPIHIYVSDGVDNKNEILRGFLESTSKNFKRIIPNFNNANMTISLDDQNVLNENYSIILISFSVESINKDKGFVMLSLPHDLLQYL